MSKLNSNDCYNDCGTWANISATEDYEQDEERYKCDDCGNVWVVPLRIKRDFGDREVLTPTQLTYSRKHSKEKRK